MTAKFSWHLYYVPCMLTTGARQALTLRCATLPLARSARETMTVHAPHPPSPHPSFVPHSLVKRRGGEIFSAKPWLYFFIPQFISQISEESLARVRAGLHDPPPIDEEDEGGGCGGGGGWPLHGQGGLRGVVTLALDTDYWWNQSGRGCTD